MTNKNRRFMFLCVFFLTLHICIYALSGITPLLPDENGQYAVYRDYTFSEETYIGFLYYDEATYAMVYVQPKTAYSVSLVLTLNTDVEYIDIAGEQFLTELTPDDAHAINYMHDMLYELGSRRKDVNTYNFNDTVRAAADYPQFGGNVTMVYDYYVPLFNLRLILDDRQKPLFELVRMGQLESASDPSFFEFTPLPSPFKPQDMPFTLDAAAEKKIITAYGQDIALTEQWISASENAWLLGDIAFLETVPLSIDLAFALQNKFSENQYLVRLFSLSTYNRQGVIASFALTKNALHMILENVFYDPNANTAMRVIQVFVPAVVIEGNTYTVLKSLTVFESVYQTHKAYFDGVIK